MIGLPSFNEEATIRNIILTAQRFGNVTVIDDGSTDKTFDIALKTGAIVRSSNKNLGYGAAIARLFSDAKFGDYDVLVTIDSDGQHDPSEIPNFIEAIKYADVVIGNRFMGNTNISSYRKFGVKTISKMNGVGDSQCGFRAYNKKAISIIANSVLSTGMGASVEIVQIAQSNNLRINEVPCTIQYGKEKHSQNSISQGFNLVTTFLWRAIWDIPTKTLLPLGLLLFFSSVMSGVQVLNLYAQSHYIVQSWALITVTFLLLTFMVFNTLIIILCFKNKKVNDNA